MATKPSFRAEFKAGEGGKTAVYMARWVNTRGEKRPRTEATTGTIAASRRSAGGAGGRQPPAWPDYIAKSSKKSESTFLTVYVSSLATPGGGCVRAVVRRDAA